MLKLYSELITSKVIAFQEQIEIGPVTKLVFDPRERVIAGLLVEDQSEKKEKALVPTEIKAIGSNFILVNDLDSISEIEDIVKITRVAKDSPSILKEKVVTESGVSLGKVTDAAINLTTLSLDRIFVRPTITNAFFARELIIPSKKIVEIRKDKIIVTDGLVKTKSQLAALAACPK